MSIHNCTISELHVHVHCFVTQRKSYHRENFTLYYWRELYIWRIICFCFFPKYTQYILVKFNLAVLSYVHLPICQINLFANISCHTIDLFTSITLLCSSRKSPAPRTHLEVRVHCDSHHPATGERGKAGVCKLLGEGPRDEVT